MDVMLQGELIRQSINSYGDTQLMTISTYQDDAAMFFVAVFAPQIPMSLFALV
jgi:hypothetical protein